MRKEIKRKIHLLSDTSLRKQNKKKNKPRERRKSEATESDIVRLQLACDIRTQTWQEQMLVARAPKNVTLSVVYWTMSAKNQSIMKCDGFSEFLLPPAHSWPGSRKRCVVWRVCGNECSARCNKICAHRRKITIRRRPFTFHSSHIAIYQQPSAVVLIVCHIMAYNCRADLSVFNFHF